MAIWICKIYARYESCKECYYTNSHRCRSNYRVNIATIVHVALASLCSYCAQYEQYIVANTDVRSALMGCGRGLPSSVSNCEWGLVDIQVKTNPSLCQNLDFLSIPVFSKDVSFRFSAPVVIVNFYKNNWPG